MIITAKFASVCPCCSQRIVPGSKVEWSKGSPAKHTACSQGPAAVVASASSRAWVAPGARGRAYARRSGLWNGCSCGAREMPDGSLSSNACAQCRYDNE